MILFSVFQTLVAFRCKICSETLEDLNKNYEEYNGENHYEILITVVSVVDGDFTESASADDTAHCGIAENGCQRDCTVGDERRHAFGNHNLGDYLERGRAHALRRFNDARIDFPETAFNKPRNERESGNDKRNDRCRCADNRADNKPCQGENHNHKNEERNRTQKVDYHVDNVERALRNAQNFFVLAGNKKHAERESDKGCKKC